MDDAKVKNNRNIPSVTIAPNIVAIALNRLHTLIYLYFDMYHGILFLIEDINDSSSENTLTFDLSNFWGLAFATSETIMKSMLLSFFL